MTNQDRFIAGAVFEQGSRAIQFEITAKGNAKGLIVWVEPVKRVYYNDLKTGRECSCSCSPVLYLTDAALRVLSTVGLEPKYENQRYTCLCQGRFLE